MKKLLVTLCAAFIASAAFGQGYIIFNNGSGSRVMMPDGSTRAPLGTPVGLFLVTPGAAPGVGGTLVLATNTYTATGLYNSGNREIASPVGSTPSLQARAWIGDSWETASLRGSGPTFVSDPLGTATAPGPLTGNDPEFGGPLQIVPEPSTIALGLLGLGAIALFRRKK